MKRFSATFKLSVRTIYCRTNRTVLCVHLRWFTCGVVYYVYICDCGQWECGMKWSNGRGFVGDWRQFKWAN